MARQDDIEDLLRQIAPLFLEIAEYAQQAAYDLGETNWARSHLVRTAAVNQVCGTARWRIVGDTIVSRQVELPPGVELSTTDEQQNQGRYYLRAPRLAVVLTIRRKPHRPDEPHAFLQLQIEGVAELAPVDFGDEIVIYLAVPPLGQQPKFEVATRGEETISYRLIDLVPEDDEEGIEAKVENLPASPPTAGPVVSSAIDDDREEGGADPEPRV
jgi:hypothetical protein